MIMSSFVKTENSKITSLCYVKASLQKKLPLFRWLLFPIAIFLTFIPSAILSSARNPGKNTSISPIMSVEKSPKIPTGIVVAPSIAFSGDDIFMACIWIITMLGISGLAHRNKIIGQFISAFLIASTALQNFLAFYAVFYNNRAIARSINGAWQIAYENNQDLLKDIQYEFSCKGFASIIDRPVEIPESFDISCGLMMVQRFGPQLYYVAMIMFISRLIQSIGVFSLTYVFQRLLYSLEEDQNKVYSCTNVKTNLESTAHYEVLHSDDEEYLDDDDDIDENLPQLWLIADFDDEIIM
ncbi:hypothetical protein G9A89_015913 [Geosiphon pyriformis]|nr:hypothetical protein G9A89_015913 [Geosiphon pyriformis]